MTFGKLLILMLMLQCFNGSVEAFVYSCEEMKYHIINTDFSKTTTFICVATPEGFSNYDHLKNIQIIGTSISLYEVALSPSGCVQQPSIAVPWNFVTDDSFALNCTQEFTVILTSDTILLTTTKKEMQQFYLSGSRRMIVEPQTDMILHTKSCKGDGYIKIYTGAGSGTDEERFDLQTYDGCSDHLPRWFFSFDNVITIEVDSSVSLTLECSNNLGSPEAPIKVGRKDRINVFTSGRSDDLQNLRGGRIDREIEPHKACIGVDTDADVILHMKLSFDSNNNGSVLLRKAYAGPTSSYPSSEQYEHFTTDYIEVQYVPTALQPNQVGNSQDSVYIAISLASRFGGVRTISIIIITMIVLAITIVFLIVIVVRRVIKKVKNNASTNNSSELVYSNDEESVIDNHIHLEEENTLSSLPPLTINDDSISANEQLPNGNILQMNSKGSPSTFESRFFAEFQVKQILGVGGFGIVFEVIHDLDMRKYAVKRIPVQPGDENKVFEIEVQALAKLDHPGIVRYHNAWMEKPPSRWQIENDVTMLTKFAPSRKAYRIRYPNDTAFTYIQMELCQCSLAEWLEENKSASSRPLNRMKMWFKQLLEAVAYIHDMNLIHRDLKPGNILFLDEDRLKVCDLGLATDRRVNRELQTEATRTNIGTDLYTSPENGEFMAKYSSKTDVFALGLIFAEMCIVITYDQRAKIFGDIRRGMKTNFTIDSETAKVVGALTQLDPESRPSCREMLDHWYFS